MSQRLGVPEKRYKTLNVFFLAGEGVSGSGAAGPTGGPGGSGAVGAGFGVPGQALAPCVSAALAVLAVGHWCFGWPPKHSEQTCVKWHLAPFLQPPFAL